MERQNLPVVKRATLNFYNIIILVTYVSAKNIIFVLDYKARNNMHDELVEMFETTKHLHGKKSISSMIAGAIKEGAFTPLEDNVIYYEDDLMTIERDVINNTITIIIEDKDYAFTSMLKKNTDKFVRRFKKIPKLLF